MLTKNIKLSDLQTFLDKTYTNKVWPELQPETIVVDQLCNEDCAPLVIEKIYALQCLNMGFDNVLALPEFVMWTTSVANNEPADFESINIPTCLELAWFIEELKKIATLINHPFEPSPEFQEIIYYFLHMEGFSTPIAPFTFIDTSKFHPGQTEEDIKMKESAIKTYIKHMEEARDD